MSLPYFKVHPPDFLNDYRWNNLPCEEYGAGQRVLLLMWQSGMQLQDDDIYIGRQINMDPVEWGNIKGKLSNLGLLVKDGPWLINSDLKTKFHAAEAYTEMQAQKRKGKKRTRRISAAKQ